MASPVPRAGVSLPQGCAENGDAIADDFLGSVPEQAVLAEHDRAASPMRACGFITIASQPERDERAPLMLPLGHTRPFRSIEVARKPVGDLHARLQHAAWTIDLDDDDVGLHLFGRDRECGIAFVRRG